MMYFLVPLSLGFGLLMFSLGAALGGMVERGKLAKKQSKALDELNNFGDKDRNELEAQLASVNIPSPESIFAPLIAMRLAKLPPDPKRDLSFFHFELTDQHTLRIDLTDQLGRPFGETPLRHSNLGRVVTPLHHSNLGRVKVGLQGPPRYRNIILSRSDQKMIWEQVCRLAEQAAAMRKAQSEAESADAALDAIDGLLGNISTK